MMLWYDRIKTFRAACFAMLSLASTHVALAVEPTPFQENETFQVADGNKFSVTYYLRSPQRSEKFPITVILQGSQCESVWNHLITEYNIDQKYKSAVLMIEKSGLNKSVTGCPESYLSRNSFEQRITDVLSVLGDVKKNIPRWNGELYVLGGSEGGLLASALSAKIFAKKVVLLVTGGGFTMAEALLIVQEAAMRKQGVPDDQIVVLLDKVKETFKVIKSNPSKSLSWGGESNTYFYWNSIFDKKAVDFMLSSKSKYLLVHGTADSSHPVESARKTVKIFADLGKLNLKYAELNGYDHSFSDMNGDSHMREVLNDSFEWMYQK